MLSDHLLGTKPFPPRGLPPPVEVDVPSSGIFGTRGGNGLRENDVEPAVAVDVGQAHALARGVEGRLLTFGRLDERAVRLLEEDLQSPFLAVGEDDVVQSVSVEIAHR